LKKETLWIDKMILFFFEKANLIHPFRIQETREEKIIMAIYSDFRVEEGIAGQLFL
jgi:hypothetical protein